MVQHRDGRGQLFAGGALPLGRRIIDEDAPKVGFNRPLRETPSACELILSNSGHHITVGPTGSGKGIGASIPALLAYDGPVIVIDPKAENLAVTARHRRRRGDRVVVLDPFGISGEKADSLNPLDLAALSGDARDDAGRALADLLTGGTASLDDPFWDNTANAFLSGILATAIADRPVDERRLSWVRDLFGDNDLPYKLAVMLDAKEVKVRDAYQEIVIFLNHPSDRTRPSIQSTASQHLRLFGSDAVRRATDKSSFPLDDLVRGAPLSVFIVIPPDKLSSHRSLLRIWLGTLMRALTSRRQIPARPTLMLIDEAAQLGRMELLLQGITLLRGYGLRLWTFWQDLSQLRGLYPLEWPTMLNNCSNVQLFGASNMTMANDYCTVAGALDPASILALGRDRQVLIGDGQVQVAKRLDYRSDPEFAGLFSPNPFYRGGR